MLSKQKLDRLMFTLGVIVIYRFATFVSVPGIDMNVLNSFYANNQNILGIFNSITGGAVSRCSIMALSLTPYIQSSIIMQLLVSIVPELKAFKKDSYQRRKIAQYSRLLTVLIAIGQSVAVCIGLENIPGLVINPGLMFKITTVVSIVSASLLIMWLSERISERGIGNGSNIIIFTGIVSNTVGDVVSYFASAQYNWMTVLAIGSIVFCFMIAIVFFELIRYIVSVFFKRSVHIFGDDSDQKYDSLPIKINPAGILPAMFADNGMIIPNVIIAILQSKFNFNFSFGIEYFTIFAKACLIAFFSVFCLSIVMSPEDVAENMKSRGAYINGVAEGTQTANYLEILLNQISTIGCFYLVFVTIFPDILSLIFKGFRMISGTSLLIAVMTATDIYDRISPEPKELSE